MNLQTNCIDTDVIVVGSGIAGLSFALQMVRLVPDCRILILCKENPLYGSTALAQGGLAIVTNFVTDSHENHVEDTMRSGGGLSDRNVVEMVVREAPERLEELLSWGIDFDRLQNGSLHLNQEGGHSACRIVHKKDFTGYELESKLLRMVKSYPQVKLLTHLFAMDIESEQIDLGTKVTGAVKRFAGLKVYNTILKCTQIVKAIQCMLASGGCGGLYTTTTNPAVSTGDGIAMAIRAGLSVRDMSFMQFHPTALFSAMENHSLFLITEALRGFGAYVCNSVETRFLFKYDVRGELATRDIVSSAMRREMAESGVSHVFIDCRHLDYSKMKALFPGVCSELERIGIDAATMLIPIVPAAHYQCGGIVVDMHCRTELDGLYASGECASTGLHGKNRLASNSLIEALVYSHRAALDAATGFKKVVSEYASCSSIELFSMLPSEVSDKLRHLRHELRIYMDLSATGFDQNTINKIDDVCNEVRSLTNELISRRMMNSALLELRNMAIVAECIKKDAISKHAFENCKIRPMHNV